MNKLESLLHHYAKGTLTPDEHQELDILTHHDEVLQAAIRRSKHLRNRLWMRLSATVALLLVVTVGGILILRSPETNSTQSTPLMIAQQNQSQPPAIHNDTPVTTVVAHTSYPIAKKSEPMVVDTTSIIKSEKPETVVACNSDCTPDSIISDIWKFLRV